MTSDGSPSAYFLPCVGDIWRDQEDHAPSSEDVEAGDLIDGPTRFAARSEENFDLVAE